MGRIRGMKTRRARGWGQIEERMLKRNREQVVEKSMRPPEGISPLWITKLWVTILHPACPCVKLFHEGLIAPCRR